MVSGLLSSSPTPVGNLPCPIAVSSRPNQSPKAIPTRSRMPSPMPSSMPCSPRIPPRASPVRRSSRPASPSSPARSRRTRTSTYPTSCASTIARIGYTDAGYRLRQQDLRRDEHDRPPVAGHRDGRRHGRRRRSGHDVRLRDRRDRRADADADHCSRIASRRRSPIAAAAATLQVAPPRRQGAGHRRVRGRQSRSPSTRSSSRTQHAEDVCNTQAPQGDHRGRHRAVDPRGAARQEDQVSHQSDRPLRHRRPAGRRGAHRPQDHRRHVRRHGPARRRRVQRQGSLQGRSLGLLRGALGRQERRRRRSRASLRGAGRVRHRRGRARLGHGRHLRHVDRAGVARS